MDLERTESGLFVPPQSRPAPEKEVAPPIIVEKGVPVTINSWKIGELVPLKGWVYEVKGINPWAIMLQLRCPTPKTAKRLGLDKKKKPCKNEFGDVEVRADGQSGE